MKEVFSLIKTILTLQKKDSSALAKKSYGKQVNQSKPMNNSILCSRAYGKQYEKGSAKNGENGVKKD